MRKLLLVVMLAVLALPATAPAKGSGSVPKNAAKACKAMRAELGADAFKAAFPAKKGKSSFGRCVSEQRKARRDARKRARKSCKAKGLRGRAMKRCIRAALAADPAPKPGDYEDGARECKEDRSDEPEEFAAKYGDGVSALGKCIADEVDDEDDAVEPDDGEDTPDDVDPVDESEDDL